MSAGQKISITLSAVDQYSAQMEAFNKRIAGMMAPIERAKKSMKRFADASGVTKVSEGFRNLNRVTLDTFRNLSRAVTPLDAIVGAASLAGLVRLTTAFSSFGSQLGFTAQRLGISASSLQTWQGAASLAGSSGQALAQGMQTLGQNLWDAAGGRNPAMVATMQYLGFSMSDVSKASHNLGAYMPQFADKIAAIKNPFAQAAVATALFGGAGEDLLPFLRLGSKGMAEYNAKAQSYGVLNAAGVTAANNLRFAQAGLTLAVQGLGNTVAEKLAPYLGPLINHMADWIAKNRDWIASGITAAVKGFVQWVEAAAPKVQHVIDLFGGWKGAARDLAILMGGAWLASMLAPIAQISTAISGVVASIGGLPVLAAIAAGGVAVALLGDWASATSISARGMAIMQNGHPKFIPTTGQIQETTGSWHKIGNRSVYSQGPSAAAQVRNQGMQYFESQGWSAAHAAAIMGNVQAESSFDPNAYSVDKRTGIAHRGLFQDDPTRWGQLTAWAKTANPTALQQYQFAQMELMTTQAAAAAALHSSQSAGAGAMAFDNGFERSGDSSDQQLSRGANAAYILSLPAGPPANIGNGSAAPAAGGVAKVTVDINYNNAPAGSSVTATSNSPAVAVGTLKVQRSMAGGGL